MTLPGCPGFLFLNLLLANLIASSSSINETEANKFTFRVSGFRFSTLTVNFKPHSPQYWFLKIASYYAINAHSLN
jgi:hypothetical protein